METNPYAPLVHSTKVPDDQPSELRRELTINERQHIRKLLLDRVHPSTFDRYCEEIGISRQNADNILANANIRRSLLRDGYRIKQTSRIAAVFLILVGFGFLLTLNPINFIAGSAIMGYGFSMYSTGSLFLVPCSESFIKRVKQI